MPGVLRVAGIVVAVEGFAMFGVALYEAVRGVTGRPSNLGLAEGAAALALVAALVLVLLGRGLSGARRWARSPTTLLQLLAVPVAIGMLQGGVPEYGVPVIVVAIVVLVLLFRRESTDAFER